MTHYHNSNNSRSKAAALRRALTLVICLFTTISTTRIWAQTIGGNVYGGGNQGDVEENTTVKLNSGIVKGNVFGGARMADVLNNENEEYASTLMVNGGIIEKDVYGGNDISGKVATTKVEIYSSGVQGDIYGGGNGSYAYTDKRTESDFYYDPGSNSLEALYLHRPHVESSFVHIVGTQDKPTNIQSNVYCGGNSATLAVNGDQSKAVSTLKIDKNVTINGVFLGSNGANMVVPEILAQYADADYSSIGLILGEGLSQKIADYMKAVSVHELPVVEWDTELDYSTRIGSFFCGGNKGSMTYDGLGTLGSTPNTLTFPDGIVVYDKIVAGCNDASVMVDDILVYQGGLTGIAADDGTKVRLDVFSRLEPALTADKKFYQNSDGTVLSSEVYQGGNIYGGCYNSGQVNGNVEINIKTDLISPNLTAGNIVASGDYIYASTLAVYGGGYGKNSVIKGHTRINLSDNARILKVYGGGEMGRVTGNTTLNMDKNLTSTNNALNAYKVYAGGYAGPVEGNTTLNLVGGRVMSAFGGACNADIMGYSQVFIGHNDNLSKGLPRVTHAVYGGNDFGGTIEGNNLYVVKVNDDITKNVRTQTYVQYVSGDIGRAVYGGSYGSYDYTAQAYYPTDSYTKPTLISQVGRTEDDADDVILTNTFVDIASLSDSPNDVIGSDNSASLTLVGGGGRGYKGLPDYVEVGQTYVLLHSKARDNGLIAQRIYGGGNLSKVNNTLVDAYTGSYGTIFGGTHGVKTTEAKDLEASYACGDTKVNIYSDIVKTDLDIYGSGANSGATGTAIVNLHGGRVHNVYGGALAEGYTAKTQVNVDEHSTVRVNALFGGGQGEDEGRPCDVGESFVTFASTSATVEDGIYGGNHNARSAKKTLVTVKVPVKNQNGNLQAIYGAGYGQSTVAGFTTVVLEPGAEVANVYGGGREGQVYNHYKYLNIDQVESYPEARYATWTTGTDDFNTKVEIKGNADKRARVMQNAFGAGLGSAAQTCGKASVYLLGGKVEGDIYGGGYQGNMPLMTESTHGFFDNIVQNISTYCVINGGDVRNVFGGGFQGDITGNTNVAIGDKDGSTFYEGVPTVLRSAYGGGEMAEVSGTSVVEMYNGYIGYMYDGTNFQPLLDLIDEGDNLLKENGNLYGAGYGEGAVVLDTWVQLYGGTVRNSLYGGGEIAAVGRGNGIGANYDISEAGHTQVRMYGGLVEGDVFGGGRGYSYDLTGNQVIGTQFYTDGYVFGSTDVEIYRGIIGTEESLQDGHGNVFGGGNIGYVYSAGEKYNGVTNGTKINGHYYKDNERTEDCRVHIAAGSYVRIGSVTIDGTTYNKGEFVPNSALNKLAYPDERWNNLDIEGVTIRNAVFAGGNVSAGSDRVYANAITVFGNATASVVDVFCRDLVVLGGEHVGGLYGDGNLTFVDGYRELNITNYGTDYYHLEKSIDTDKYNSISSVREKVYYKYDNTNKKWIIDSTSGRTMNTIQRADFCGVFGSRFLLHGAQDRVPDEVDYTNYTINRVGEVSLNGKSYDNGQTTHGNYFGIYNIVNLLGALTSDVDLRDIRQADLYEYVDTEEEQSEPTKQETYKPGNTYYDFKFNNLDKGFRNNAKSHNMVALASGVYLELIESISIDENTTVETKNYGPVTGVIELDLLNVTTGEGGGYVYAKDMHRTQSVMGDKIHLTLSDANQDAVTKSAYSEADNASVEKIQTSGNFVHNEKRIVDGCFNDDVHYWYVSGNIYIYDQKISAYTGAARLYEQSISLPFTNGLIKIENIGMNKYFVGTNDIQSLTVGNKTYQKGDIITYWDWSQLELDENKKHYQNYFVDVIYVDDNGNIATTEQDNFYIANEMSHGNGYMLTFEMDNPVDWGNKTPTIKCNTSGIYGQREYHQEDLVGQAVIDEHNAIIQTKPEGQATFETAYVAVENITIDGTLYNKGSYINAAAFKGLSVVDKNKFEKAYICLNTLQLNETDYIFVNELISKSEYEKYNANQQKHFSQAYVCTVSGKYGGKYFEEDKDYGVLEICALPNAERNQNFTFNKDALDLLESFDDYPKEPYKKQYDIVNASIETSTLYVPRESDFQNLSKDKIVTLVLTYIPKISDGIYDSENPESHVINIHVQFKNGLPVIDDVTAPATVLPNTTVGLSVPSITPGAYEIIGGGWEIYRTQEEAESHKNGVSYLNNATPMYWYQDGYYVAYYAKTYLGKAYSNPVPFSVANYHHIKEVMNHMVKGENGSKVNEYMYIDHEHASRNRAPKIYLDNAEDLNLLKALYQKTLDQNALESIVRGCDNLDFILRGDIDVTEEWNPIGDDSQCFAGTLHGNGYIVSGLNNSLFGNLCGKVYNLGVTGSFMGGGIADNGGTAENCWVYTTGTPSSTTNAVIGTGGSIKNSYYHADNAYSTTGNAIVKSAAEFAKGEVAYSLNSYHINKTADNSEGYVEKYFVDGDFIYAKGQIPLNKDERYDEYTKTYIPIDDDYIFFGQRLTYDKTTHENSPSRIRKYVTDSGSERIDRTANGNRIYSVPAYYKNKNKDEVFFNTDARFIDRYNNWEIHQGLTAIDFTDVDKDYEGLQSIMISGLTPNLLVYADPENDQDSYSKLNAYLNEPSLSYSNDSYRTVAKQTQTIRGHLVDLVDDEYIASRDHFLVDMENFHVPIAYTFAEGKHIWYQRTPDRFANRDGKGWNIVCLPFTAKLVTTHQKGEITHFYSDSKTMHEYWLREWNSVATEGSDTKATFVSLEETGDMNYTVENDFLSDYYYSKYNDKNSDTYLDYYSQSRIYEGYSCLQANIPYIISFPGANYYEFDMSGAFVPQNTATSIEKLEPQVVTMVSVDNAKIGVTSEMIVDNAFVGTFQKKTIENGYHMDDDGCSFVKTVNKESVPFRGYLKGSWNTRQIFIGDAVEEEEQEDETTDRGLTIYGKKGTICIESTLEEETTVYVHHVNGQLIKVVTVQPMSKEVVPVSARGIYIVDKRKVVVL